MSELRIMPEEVVTAYQETGVKPGPYSIGLVQDDCVVQACGLGAVGLYRGIWNVTELVETVSGVLSLSEVTYERMRKIYGRDYVIGFQTGFDLPIQEDGFIDDVVPSRYAIGRRDGNAAAARIKEGVPAVEVPDYPPVEVEVLA